MTIQNLAWAFEQRCPDPLAKLMLVTYAAEMGDNPFATITPQSLGEKFECHPVRALNSLFELHRLKLIIVQCAHDDGSYTFQFNNMAEADYEP